MLPSLPSVVQILLDQFGRMLLRRNLECSVIRMLRPCHGLNDGGDSTGLHKVMKGRAHKLCEHRLLVIGREQIGEPEPSWLRHADLKK
jgi:hypothetical protein